MVYLIGCKEQEHFLRFISDQDTINLGFTWRHSQTGIRTWFGQYKFTV